MNGVDEYKKKFPQAWDNFEKDSNLSHAAKTAFINHLKKFKSGAIQDHAKNFFVIPTNQLIGPKVDLKHNEVLGRVINQSAFNDRIDNIYDSASKGTAPSIKGSASILKHMVPSNDNKLKLLKRFLGMESLSNFNIMWSFRNKHYPNKPFNNKITPTDMPCVLGLDNIAPPFYCLEYKLLHRAHLPTAFDARTRSAWRPGGRTYPLDSCRGLYPNPKGLPELVHEPTTFNDLERPVEVIK